MYDIKGKMCMLTIVLSSLFSIGFVALLYRFLIFAFFLISSFFEERGWLLELINS